MIPVSEEFWGVGCVKREETVCVHVHLVFFGLGVEEVWEEGEAGSVDRTEVPAKAHSRECHDGERLVDLESDANADADVGVVRARW